MAKLKAKVQNSKTKKVSTTKVSAATVSKPRTKTTKPKIETSTVKTVTPYSENLFITISEKITKFRPNRYVYLALIVIGIILLVINKKSWFIVAMVDGQPISNLQLQMELNQQFRSQTVTQLINEKIVMDEAAKNNAVPTEADIDAKIAEIETSVGGAQALDGILAQQGQDRKSIRSQIKFLLIREKLYSNEATVSAQEVDDFISQNKNSMRATDSAGEMKEATDAIKQQKLSQIFEQKFQELKQKANVQTF